MDKIKVLMVDDHAVLRDGVRALLGVCSDIEVVGEAADGREAIDKAKALSPNVVIMDLAMPGVDGLAATRRIVKTVPGVRVLMLSQYDDGEHVTASIKAGALGYVPKRALGAELISAVRAVYRGEGFLCPSAASAVIQDYRKQIDRQPADALTEREREVLRLIAEGYSSRGVAERLIISLKTVLAHRANIMKKLDLHSRTDLVKYALRRGLVAMDMPAAKAPVDIVEGKPDIAPAATK